MIGLRILERCLHLGRWREQETKIKDTHKMYSKKVCLLSAILTSKSKSEKFNCAPASSEILLSSGWFLLLFLFYFAF